MTWFLYMIECKGGSIYTGIATDVAARYAAHKQGKGAKYTRAFPPLKLLIAVEYPDRSEASKAEYAAKQMTASQKRAYCKTNGTMDKLTIAGQKMLQRFLDAEASGRLVKLCDGRSGAEFAGIQLPDGDGGQKATAERLKRQGLADFQWTRSLGSHRGKYLWITDAGRAAMATIN